MGCDDIKIAENGVDYIFVPKSKNTAGIRKVPIASVLIELGFLEYVKEVRASGAKRLFPHRSFVNGTYSKRLSEEMLKYQKARGIKEVDDRKSFHSFRVNVITELANKGSNTIQVMKIVGHKNGEQGIEVHAGYVRDLPDLKKIVDLLSWPVDIQALKYQGQFQAFVSDPKNWAISKKPRKKTSAAKVKAAAQ
jgi:integrase